MLAYSTISLEIAWAYKSTGCASKLSFAWKIQQLKEQKMLGARKVHKLRHVNISGSPMRNSDCRAGMNFHCSLPNKKVDLRQSNPHNLLLHGWSLRHVGIVFATKANWSNVHLMRIETDARPVRVFADCMFPSVFVHLIIHARHCAHELCVPAAGVPPAEHENAKTRKREELNLRKQENTKTRERENAKIEQCAQKHFEHRRYHSFGHVWCMYRSSPFRSTFNTNIFTALCKKCVTKQSILQHFEQLCAMCKACTEAVHSVAHWTWTLPQLWACVKYVPKQSIPYHLEHKRDQALGMCKVCTEAVHSVALWTRTLSQLWACAKTARKQSIP